jgi:tetratricopeptide (TPR) repeat protein
MSKTAAKTKTTARVDEELGAYRDDPPVKRDLKMLIFGIWLVIIVGLMAVFLFTTSPNFNEGAAPTQVEGGSQGGGPGDLAAKLRPMQEALAQDPNNVEALVGIGFTYLDARQLDEAAANFQKAESLAPQNVDALIGLGVAYQGMGRQNEALAKYDQALEISPNNDFAKARKGYFLAEVSKDYEGALVLLREVEAKLPLGTLKTSVKSNIAEIEKLAAQAQ